MDVDVEFGVWSRRGARRSVNDDHYLVLRLGRHQETLMTSLPTDDLPQRFDEYGYGMVIADGMGAAGESASRLAITTLVGLAIEFGRWHVRITEPIAHEVVDRIERFYRSVDSTLLQASYHGGSGLRTTVLDGDRVLLCTNGLTDVITDDGISNELRAHGTPDDQSRARVDLAAELGGTDDVTALIAYYRIRPRAGGVSGTGSQPPDALP